MKCVILVGGMQSTLTRENEYLQKPMIEIGGKPLLWHIMKHFSEYGIKEFIVCGGYKIEVIKEYFKDFYIYQSDITVDLSSNEVVIHNKRTENWKVSVVDTGLESGVLQRIVSVKDLLEGDFIVTFGDCLSDIDVDSLVKKHRNSDALCTTTLVKSSGRKKFIGLRNGHIENIDKFEADAGFGAWVNGDCYVLNSKVLGDIQTKAENELFEMLDAEGKVAVYEHRGFWTAVETMRDLTEAESLWDKGIATWISTD